MRKTTGLLTPWGFYVFRLRIDRNFLQVDFSEFATGLLIGGPAIQFYDGAEITEFSFAHRAGDILELMPSGNKQGVIKANLDFLKNPQRVLSSVNTLGSSQKTRNYFTYVLNYHLRDLRNAYDFSRNYSIYTGEQTISEPPNLSNNKWIFPELNLFNNIPNFVNLTDERHFNELFGQNLQLVFKPPGTNRLQRFEISERGMPWSIRGSTFENTRNLSYYLIGSTSKSLAQQGIGVVWQASSDRGYSRNRLPVQNTMSSDVIETDLRYFATAGRPTSNPPPWILLYFKYCI